MGVTDVMQSVLDQGFGFLRRSSYVILVLVFIDAIFVAATMALTLYPLGLIFIVAAVAVLLVSRHLLLFVTLVNKHHMNLHYNILVYHALTTSQ